MSDFSRLASEAFRARAEAKSSSASPVARGQVETAGGPSPAAPTAQRNGTNVRGAALDRIDPEEIDMPAGAKDHLLDLREQVRTARALSAALHRERDEATLEKQRLVARLHELEKMQPLPAAAIAAENKKLEAVQAQLERIDKRAAANHAIVAPTGALLARCERWLAEATHSVLEEYQGPEPELRKHETVSDAVERCRRRVRELLSEIADLRAAPRPSTDAKRRVDVTIEELRRRGRPDVAPLLDRRPGRVEFRAGFSDVIGAGGAGLAGRAIGIDPVALIAWMMPDELKKALHAEIDAVKDDARALNDNERAEKLAAARSDLLQVERDEEHFIRQASAAGVTIARRSDCDPRAILGLVSPVDPRQSRRDPD